MGTRVTAPALAAMKGRGERIVCVTAYDAAFGRMADEAGVDVVLVGDSLGNVILGYSTTIPVTLEEMLHHTRAASRGVSEALLVADLPFGSYQASVEQAVGSATSLMKAGAEAVKLEGDYPEVISALVRAGIPTMAHVGFTPQSVHKFGGFKVQGRGDSGEGMIDVTSRLEEAGAFSIVLELIPAALAEKITAKVRFPTIGIGAGLACDGQIQVLHDVLGLSPEILKHAKPFTHGRADLTKGLEDYAREVRAGAFPEAANSF